jgi:histone acetyltransferase (RNA polymerase elongator complex component)
MRKLPIKTMGAELGRSLYKQFMYGGGKYDPYSIDECIDILHEAANTCLVMLEKERTR